MLASSIYASILNHRTLEKSLAFVLSSKLESSVITAIQYNEIFNQVFEDCEKLQTAIREDLKAIKLRDPACPSYAHALLYMKGFHGVTS